MFPHDRAARSSKLLLSLLVVLFLVSCSKDHEERLTNPRDPARGGIDPPTVSGLRVEVGSRVGRVYWSLEDSSNVGSVRGYTVWIRPVGSDEYAREDSVAAPPGRLSGMINGQPYFVAVRPAMSNGLQGALSRDLRFTTGLFSVVIEDGQERTPTARVTLSLQAPTGTQGVRLSDQEDLTDVAVVPFRANLSWELDPTDGTQQVYAQFIDAEGTSSIPVWDEIILDTQASIRSLDLVPGTGPVQPGETVTFTMDTGETKGTAWVILGQDGRRKDLRDDGTAGDAQSEDGVYTLDYVVENDLRVVDAQVTGQFVDAAGNLADPRVAPQRLTVGFEPPSPVTLDEPSGITATRVILTWSRSVSPDFSAYRIVRAETEDVLSDPDRVILDEIINPSITILEDTREIEQGLTYYYVVVVVDDLGASSNSNIVSADIPNLVPRAVNLFEPSVPGETSIALSWTDSAELDFASYRLYRSDKSGVDEQDLLITEIDRAEVTQWLETGLIENTRYYYRLFVADKGDLTTGSNELAILTANADPAPVTLSSLNEDEDAFLTTVNVDWTESAAHDFDRYSVYRDTSPGVTPSSPLVRSILDDSVTQLEDSGILDNTLYSYRVFVFDDQDGYAGSNELEIATDNRPPPAVNLSVTAAGGGSISLDWTESQAHDFASYALYRGTDSSSFPVLVGTWTERQQTAHSVAIPGGNTTLYFFRLTVSDRGIPGNGDESSFSNVVSARGNDM
jgi:fibronectin type 3 domain-containing protein